MRSVCFLAGIALVLIAGCSPNLQDRANTPNREPGAVDVTASAGQGKSSARPAAAAKPGEEAEKSKSNGKG